MPIIRLCLTGVTGLLRFISRPESVYLFAAACVAVAVLFFHTLHGWARDAVARYYPQTDLYGFLQTPLFLLLTVGLLFAGRRLLFQRTPANWLLFLLALSVWNYQEKWLVHAFVVLKAHFPLLDRETFLFGIMLVPAIALLSVAYSLLIKLIAIILGIGGVGTDASPTRSDF